MMRAKKDKDRFKAKKTIGVKTTDTTSNEGVENLATLLDTTISTKSSSLIVSSLYLISLAVIILVLAVVIGFVSFVYSYNIVEKSAAKFGFRHGEFDKKVFFQEDTDMQDNNYDGLNENVHSYLSESNDPDFEDSAHPYDSENSDSELEDVFSYGSHSSDHDLDKNLQPHISNSDQSESQKQTRAPEIDKRVSVSKPTKYPEHRYLRHSYTHDFEKVLKLRLEAMKKYSYPYSTDGVDKRSNLSLQEFYDVYDGKWPVIITDVIPSWPASAWSTKTLKAKYGKARVAMMTYNILDDDQTKGKKEGFSVPLEIFLDHLNVSHSESWTYIQDEVFLAQYPELRRQILDSVYSQEDFFNLFPKEIRPWDCLFLWGTAHSRSTMHIDPYNWTGTNAVIVGHKKWKLLLPGQDKHLSVFPDAGCGFPLECQKYNSKYDMYSTSDQIKRKLKKLKYLEVDQLSGEMLFLPTGWFHQAYNLVPTLAISGEIMNRNNYLAVLEEIFHVGNLPRSVLPANLENLTPKELVEFVMSKMPARILKHGAEWTKMNIANLYNGSGAAMLEGAN